MNQSLSALESSLKDHWQEFISQVSNIILAILIIIIGFLISRFISRLFRKTIARGT